MHNLLTLLVLLLHLTIQDHVDINETKLISMKIHDSDTKGREQVAYLHGSSCCHSFSCEELVLQLDSPPPAKHLVMVVKMLCVRQQVPTNNSNYYT